MHFSAAIVCNMCVQSVREVTEEDVSANLLLLSRAGSSLENAESVNMLMLINVSMSTNECRQFVWVRFCNVLMFTWVRQIHYVKLRG